MVVVLPRARKKPKALPQGTPGENFTSSNFSPKTGTTARPRRVNNERTDIGQRFREDPKTGNPYDAEADIQTQKSQRTGVSKKNLFGDSDKQAEDASFKAREAASLEGDQSLLGGAPEEMQEVIPPSLVNVPGGGILQGQTPGQALQNLGTGLGIAGGVAALTVVGAPLIGTLLGAGSTIAAAGVGTGTGIAARVTGSRLLTGKLSRTIFGGGAAIGLASRKLNEAESILGENIATMDFIVAEVEAGRMSAQDAHFAIMQLEQDIDKTQGSVKYLTGQDTIAYLAGGKDTLVKFNNAQEFIIPSLRLKLMQADLARRQNAILEE